MAAKGRGAEADSRMGTEGLIETQLAKDTNCTRRYRVRKRGVIDESVGTLGRGHEDSGPAPAAFGAEKLDSRQIKQHDLGIARRLDREQVLVAHSGAVAGL